MLDLGEIPFFLGVTTVQFFWNVAHTQGLLTVGDQANGGPTARLTPLGAFRVGTFNITTDGVTTAQNATPSTLIKGPF